MVWLAFRCDGLVLLITSVWAEYPHLLLLKDLTFSLVTLKKGDFSKWRKELCCQHSVQIVSSHVRVDMLSYPQEGDPFIASSKRAEIRHCPANSEQWYGFSNYLLRLNDPSFEIMLNFRPDLSLGEEWRTHRWLFTGQVVESRQPLGSKRVTKNKILVLKAVQRVGM